MPFQTDLLVSHKNKESKQPSTARVVKRVRFSRRHPSRCPEKRKTVLLPTSVRTVLPVLGKGLRAQIPGTPTSLPCVRTKVIGVIVPTIVTSSLPIKVGKAFTHVLLVQLQALASRIHPKLQCGFRACSWTVDIIFLLHQAVIETCREQ